MQKLLKNNKGFTLVEVIVVAVIVLVLAAVAIPLYTSYVRDSRIAAASNIAGSIATTLGTVVSQNGVYPQLNAVGGPYVTSIAISAGGIGETAGYAIPANFTAAVGADRIVTVSYVAGTYVTAKF